MTVSLQRVVNEVQCCCLRPKEYLRMGGAQGERWFILDYKQEEQKQSFRLIPQSDFTTKRFNISLCQRTRRMAQQYLKKDLGTCVMLFYLLYHCYPFLPISCLVCVRLLFFSLSPIRLPLCSPPIHAHSLFHIIRPHM